MITACIPPGAVIQRRRHLVKRKFGMVLLMNPATTAAGNSGCVKLDKPTESISPGVLHCRNGETPHEPRDINAAGNQPHDGLSDDGTPDDSRQTHHLRETDGKHQV